MIARFELKEDNLGTIDFETNNGFAVRTYPNPVTDIMNVFIKSNTKNLKLRIYDISGRLVGNPVGITGGQQNDTAIPVSYLKTGIYIYTLTENNKVVFRDKIIKK